MPIPVGWRIRTYAVALLALCCVSTSTFAQWTDVLAKIPESPNAIALFDVATLRKYAKTAKNEEAVKIKAILKEISDEISNSIDKMAIISSVDLDAMDPSWELGLIDFKNMPSIEDIARIEGGYIEEISGHKVVYSERNGYMIPTKDPNKLASIKPANRQLVKRWLKIVESGQSAGVSNYIRQAADFAGDDVPVVFAVDLEDAISPTMVKARASKLLSVQGHEDQLPAIEELIPKCKGLIFAIQLKDGFKGKLRIDFDGSAAPLEKIGKNLVLEILGRRGMAIDDMTYWTATVSGNSISLVGDLTPSGLSNVLNFHRTAHSIGSMSQMAETMSQSPSKSPEQLAAAASQMYFKSVKKAVDEVRTFKAQTMGQKATWNERAARRIDDLPLLNVDEGLISYGGEVSGLLRSSGTEIRSANLAGGTAKAGQNRTQYGGGYGWGISYNSANPGISQANAQATERGMNSHINNLKTIQELTAKIRAEMSKKYNVEF